MVGINLTAEMRGDVSLFSTSVVSYRNVMTELRMECCFKFGTLVDHRTGVELFI